MAVTIKSPREIELMREAEEFSPKRMRNWRRIFYRACPPGILIIWERNHPELRLHSLVQKLQRLSRIDLRLCQ